MSKTQKNMNDQNLKVAVIQISSQLDYRENLNKIKAYLKEASENGAKAVFLPECFYTLSDGKNPSPYLVERDNEHFLNIQNLAKEFGVYLIGGSVAHKVEEGIKNRVYNFNPMGEVIGEYDKINLFSCDILKDGQRKKINEADIFSPGEKPLIIDVEGFKVGIAVCFDLRFPNLLLNYYREKVDILTFASAFTVPTGKAHWHTLLRARAIEGQCYVIAAGQCGQNNPNIRTFGHSLIVGPWGEICDDAGEDEGIIYSTLEKSQINETRSRIHVDLGQNY